MSISSRFLVQGMDCGDCATSLESHLLRHPKVTFARVTFLTRLVEVTHSPVFSLADAQQAAKDLGFSATLAPTASARFLSVRFEADAGQLSPVPLSSPFLQKLVSDGMVTNVSDRGEGRYVLEYTSSPKVLLAALEEGYRTSGRVSVHPSGSFGEATPALDLAKRWRDLFLISALLSIPVLFFSFIFPTDRRLEASIGGTALRTVTLVNFFLSTPVLVLIGRHLYRTAYLSLRNARRANMDCLVMLSTTVAYAYSVAVVIEALSRSGASSKEGTTFFEVPSILLCLIVLGRWLEVRAKSSTSDLLREVLNLQVTEARLLPPLPASSGCSKAKKEACCSKPPEPAPERVIPVELVEPGDLLRVLPGARIPVDGTVVSGLSEVDESSITGESAPVAKGPGKLVFGSTVNGPGGALTMRADAFSSDSAAASIQRLVTEAQAEKAPVQRTADMIAARFVPCILVMSLVTFCIWVALAASHSVATGGQAAVPFALQFALSVLVVSCPCAVALAVPTAVCVGTAVAARFGAVVKGGGVVLEMFGLGRLVVVFDKTGTLTRGAPQVTAHEIADRRFTDNAFLSLVASAELQSEHPLAKACVAYAAQKGAARVVEPDDFLSEPGKGVSASVMGRSVAVGTIEWVRDSEGAVPPQAIVGKLEALSEGGNIVICVAIDGGFAGHLVLGDQLREEAGEVVAGLAARGVAVRVLTGDRRGTALFLARQLGLPEENVDAQMLPAGKVDRVKALQREGFTVCFVGDGVNDAPALVAADVGIAVASGTQISIASADIVLMHHDLRGVLLCVDLSRAVMRRIKINFAWAAMYNFIAIPVAAGLFYPVWRKPLPPALAGVSELLSSLPVVLFSLLLQRFKVSK